MAGVEEADHPRSWVIDARRPPTNRGRRTRSKVIEAARNLFSTRYYPEVTLADIAEASGLSVGTFYGYFESKEEVFLELLSNALVEMYSEARSGWRAGEDGYHGRLRATTLGYVTAYYRNRHIMRSAYFLAARDDVARELLWSWRRDLEAQMGARLVQDQRASSVAPLPPELLIRVLQSMVDEYVCRAYADEEFGSPTEQDLKQAANVLADVWFRAIFGSEPEVPSPKPRKNAGRVKTNVVGDA